MADSPSNTDNTSSAPATPQNRPSPLNYQPHKKAARTQRDTNFEHVLYKLGGFGRYQKQHWLVILFAIYGAIILNMHAFLHLADVPLGQGSGMDSIERATGYCAQLDNNQTNTSTLTETQTAMAIEIFYAPLCADMKLVAALELMHPFGMLLGALLYGQMAAFTGYKWGLLSALVINLLTGLGGALCMQFGQSHSALLWLLMGCCLLNGMSCEGVFVCGSILMGEISNMERRFIMYTITGHHLLAAPAYALFIALRPNTVQLLYSVNAAGAFVAVIYLVLVRESPRWLLAHGRNKQAIELLREMESVNRVKGRVGQLHMAQVDYDPHDWTYVALLRSPTLRWRTFALAVLWCTTFLCLLGEEVQLKEALPVDYGHVHGIAEVGITLFSMLFVIALDRRYGRVTILLVCLIGNLFLTSLTTIVRELPPNYECKVVVVLLLVLCRVVMSPMWVVIYVLSVELLPCHLRSCVQGGCSATARLTLLGTQLLVHLAPHNTEGVSLTMCAVWPMFCVLISCSCLPETKGQPLPDTKQQAEAIRI